MENKASAIIYTREKYIGFPGWFKVQPEDLPEKTAKKLMEKALAAVNELDSIKIAHKIMRVVIAEDGFVVLGVSAYMRDLFADGWEALDWTGNRLGFAFVGYVWKQSEFTQPLSFPDKSAYEALLAEHIRPYFEYAETDPWASHQEQVPYRYDPAVAAEDALMDFTPARICGAEEEEKLVSWAIRKAARGE